MVRVCSCVYVCVHVCARTCVRVCALVCACVYQMRSCFPDPKHAQHHFGEFYGDFKVAGSDYIYICTIYEDTIYIYTYTYIYTTYTR